MRSSRAVGKPALGLERFRPVVQGLQAGFRTA
jgi:hypothetical protein